MNEDTKVRMVEGKNQTRTIRNYLTAVRQKQTNVGSQTTLEKLQAQLDKVQSQLQTDHDVIEELALRNTQIVLQREIKGLNKKPLIREKMVNLDHAQAEFVKVAKAYSDKRGILYAAWRQLGVPAQVLIDAGFRGRGVHMHNPDGE